MIYILLTLALTFFVIWVVFKVIAAFRDHPEVGKMIKNSFKKKPNSMKKHNFSEYPVVIADGLIFEILETKRIKGRIWKIKLNVFNATDESKQLNLMNTLYKWDGKKEIELISDSSYRVKSGTGLVSSSDMIVWSLKKPSEISITFKSNNKPGYANINLHKAVKVNKVSKSSPVNETVKKEIIEDVETISDSEISQNTEKNNNSENDKKFKKKSNNSQDNPKVNNGELIDEAEQEEQRKINGE